MTHKGKTFHFLLLTFLTHTTNNAKHTQIHTLFLYTLMNIVKTSRTLSHLANTVYYTMFVSAAFANRPTHKDRKYNTQCDSHCVCACVIR